MTDLEKAIAELRRVALSKTEHLLAPPCEPFATILNAVVSGGLITREASEARAGALLRGAPTPVGLFAALTDEQQRQALAFCGNPDFGPAEAAEDEIAERVAELEAEVLDRNTQIVRLGEHSTNRLEALIAAEAKLAERDAEVARLREALTPSGDTKAEYSGEFSVRVYDIDEDENEVPRDVLVDWTTIKAIMATISARAARPLRHQRRQAMIASEYRVVIANAVKAHMRLSPEFRKQIAAYVASAGTEGQP